VTDTLVVAHAEHERRSVGATASHTAGIALTKLTLVARNACSGT